ncbi:MAG: glycosyltransferase family 9 protein [Bacteroidota bacterium]|nr:glycosyltransferase family 9 protein [Bacteroidota bacterium]
MKRSIGNIWLHYLNFKNSFNHNTKFEKSSIKNILLIELSRMGDVVAMIPALKCLMYNFPDCNISIAVDKNYTGIFSFFNASGLLNGANIKLISNDKTDTINGLRSAEAALQDQRFDLVCSMSPSFRNAFLILRLKAVYKVGFFRANSLYTPFLENNLIEAYGISNFSSISFKNENIEERGIKICDALGIGLQLPVISNKKMFPFLSNEPYIVLHPLSGWKYRNWKMQNYADLINRIIDVTKVQVVIIGSEEEKLIGEQLKMQIRNKTKITTVFEAELENVMHYLSNTLLFIGNDSGPLHLASALGVQSIGLFGPAPPELTAPQNKQNFYFYKKVDCSPCKQINCIRPYNTCMDLIQVDEVVQKAVQIIKSKLELKEVNV